MAYHFLSAGSGRRKSGTPGKTDIPCVCAWLTVQSDQLQKDSEGKYLYRLQLNGIETEEFVVSNGTPCDHYYEVLDALTINPVVVRTIIKYMDKKFDTERNNAGKFTFETSLLFKHLAKLKSEEFKKDRLSLFDLAMLLKVSSPQLNSTKK